MMTTSGLEIVSQRLDCAYAIQSSRILPDHGIVFSTILTVILTVFVRLDLAALVGSLDFFRNCHIVRSLEHCKGRGPPCGVVLWTHRRL